MTESQMTLGLFSLDFPSEGRIIGFSDCRLIWNSTNKMDSRYKTKAIIGIVAWIVAPFAVMVMVALLLFVFGVSGANAVKPLIISFFLAQYVAFFWGCSHLAKAKGYSNAIILFGILCPVVQLIILALLLFALPDKYSRSPSPVRKKKHHCNESPIARIVRYRRNALVGNVFGVIGIFMALVLIFVPMGLFASRDSMYLTALAVFIPSYIAVISGCWWWVKAKNWHEAVVFIGLMPLGVLCIRYVRLIYIAIPLLFPATMVLMPILLVGVVAVLPDKSGMPKRKRWDHDP